MKPLIYTLSLTFFCFLVIYFSPFSSATKIIVEPSFISKGTNGYSLIIEIDYSTQELPTILKELKDKNALLLLESNWIERSPGYLKQIKELRYDTGILLHYEDSIETAITAINTYQASFNKNVLWAVCAPVQCNDKLKQFLFEQQINLLNPSIQIEHLTIPKLNKGDIISMPITRESKYPTSLLTELKSIPFISIEDNVTGLTVNSKRYP